MAYKISLSNKTEVQIDREELDTVIKGIESGSRLIKVKSAMFNPAFIVSIEPDARRLEGEKYLPKQLPDLFQRVGSMKKVEDIIKIEEPKVPVAQVKEWLGSKPEFIETPEK